MSRTRERILANLDDMYREAFERAKATATTRRWRRSTSPIGASSCTSRSCSTSATRSNER